MGILGRQVECDALDRLLTGAHAGHSGVTVLRGEAGVGKSALLGYLSGRVDGWRVATAVGVESEMELAYSGLHQLCARLLDHLERLPAPQRDALATVFGLHTGPAPDRFLVGLATLTLFAEVAEQQPLICIVDDAQWLDDASAQLLGFVARRLLAERVVLVFAARTGIGDDVLAGLPELPVRGLGDSDARALLLENMHAPLDAAVCEQIITESHGNPLALLELPRTWDPAELAGGFGLPDSQPLVSQDRGELRDGASACCPPTPGCWCSPPPPSRSATRCCCIVPPGRSASTWRRPTRRWTAALLEVRGRVQFAHPLVRSAAYRSAAAAERHRVHLALAEATDGEADPDRRAWHRARATSGPDEDVAAELERSAGRAQARGGLAAAAAFLAACRRAHTRRRAPGPSGRWPPRRASTGPARWTPRCSCWRWRRPGRSTRSSAPAPTCCAPRSPSPSRAAATLRRCCSTPPNGSSRSTPTLARETYLDAFSAAVSAGRLARGGGMAEVAEAVLAADWGASSRESPRACDLLLDGLAVWSTEGYAAGVPMLKHALSAFRAEPMSEEQALRWLWLACHTVAGHRGRRGLGRADRAARSSSPAGPEPCRCCPWR